MVKQGCEVRKIGKQAKPAPVAVLVSGFFCESTKTLVSSAFLVYNFVGLQRFIDMVRLFFLVSALFVFTDFAHGQSVADRLFARKMAAQELKGKLGKLGADEIVNQEGSYQMAVDVIDPETEVRDVLAGSLNFTPWIQAGDAKTGAIGRLRYPFQVGGVSHDHAIFEVNQVVDGDSFIGRCFGKTYWVSGVDTSDLTDGSEFLLKEIIEVLGSKTYSTAAGGTNTVTHLSVTDRATEVDKIRKSLAANPPEKSSNFYRTWTFKKGGSQTGKLQLTNKTNYFKVVSKSGKAIDIKLTMLSKESKKTAKAVAKKIEQDAAKQKAAGEKQ